MRKGIIMRVSTAILIVLGMCLITACPPESQAKPQHYVVFNWQGTQPFVIYRNVNGGAFTPIANVITTSYTDNNVSVSKKYCYYVKNQYGQSNTACATIPNGPQLQTVIGTVSGGTVE